MKKIHTEKAPAALGPYSQAIEAGNWLFLSGQVALNPKTGRLENDSIASETHQIFTNIRAVLNEAGLTLENVVKCSVFLKDMADFATVNEVYSQYFDNHQPARECVAVRELPVGAQVEISVIAMRS